MATCFCERFARNFAVSPDGLCIALFSNCSDSLAQRIPAPNPCPWHVLGPVLLCAVSPRLRLIRNPRSSGRSAPCRAKAGFWVGTSPLVAGVWGQEGLVVEHGRVSHHIPWDIHLCIQQVAEQSSGSSSHLVSTREQASCKSWAWKSGFCYQIHQSVFAYPASAAALGCNGCRSGAVIFLGGKR